MALCLGNGVCNLKQNRLQQHSHAGFIIGTIQLLL